MNPPKRCGETSPTTSSVLSVTVAVLGESAGMSLSPRGAAERLFVLPRQHIRLCIRRGPPLGFFGVNPDVFVRRRQRFLYVRLKLRRREIVFGWIFFIPALLPPVEIHPQPKASGHVLLILLRIRHQRQNGAAHGSNPVVEFRHLPP